MKLGARRLTTDSDDEWAFSWSPDGTQIVFTTGPDAQGQDLWKINVDGTGLTQLTSNSERETFPSWNPNGLTIAYDWESPTSNTDIFVMNNDGSNKIQLTSNVVDEEGPSYSPDGTKIAYARATDTSSTNYDIWVMDADGTNQTRLTTHPDSEFWGITWSPDGSKIAFSAGPPYGPPKNIVVINSDGTNRIELTSRSDTNINPSWSPDGRKIAFASDRSGNYEIWVMNSDGTNQIELTNDPSEDRFPVWCPTGEKIAFISDRSGNYDIWIQEIEPRDRVFDPLIDGFSFPNYGYLDSPFGGHCFGMAETAILINTGEIDIDIFNPLADNTYQLSRNDGDLEWVILFHQLRFVKNNINAIMNLPSADVSDQFMELRTIIESGKPALVLAGDSENAVKHAVVVFAIESEDSTHYQLSVYDPNQPGIVHSATVVPSGDRFIMDFVNVGGSIGGLLNKFMALEATPTITDLSRNMLWVQVSSLVEVHVYDANGNEIGEGVSDGKTHAVPISNPTNGNYKIKIIGVDEGDYHLTIARTFNDQAVYENSTGQIGSGETVEYAVSLEDGEITLGKVVLDSPLVNFLVIGIVIVVIVIAIALVVLKRRKEKSSE